MSGSNYCTKIITKNQAATGTSKCSTEAEFYLNMNILEPILTYFGNLLCSSHISYTLGSSPGVTSQYFLNIFGLKHLKSI